MGTNYSESIPLRVFIGLNGLLMGLALLMAVARMLIRFHAQRRLLPDDFILMFACSTFVTSQTLLYITKIEDLYWIGGLLFEPMNPPILASILEDPEAFNRRVLKIERTQFSAIALTFTSIFAVKICFLLFFYEMITRLRRLILAWKVIFGITVIFGALCTSTAFIGCPHFVLSVDKCSRGRGFTRSLATSIISSLLDITSDLLLLSIPLILLWRVKIKRQQKNWLYAYKLFSFGVGMQLVCVRRLGGISCADCPFRHCTYLFRSKGCRYKWVKEVAVQHFAKFTPKNAKSDIFQRNSCTAQEPI